jgi:outer membrane protein OmpA-like peptidoglycan-associated protein
MKRFSRGFWLAAVLAVLPRLSLAAAPGGPEEDPMPPNFQDAKPVAGTARAPTEETLTATTPSESPAASGDADSYLPSLSGPIGLYRVTTADVGPKNHLRLALHGEYFSSSELLVSGDDNRRLLGEFTFGFTPHQNVEIFGGLLSSSNRNTRVSESGRRDPELIKSFGDLVLGGKAAFPVAPGTTVGFEGGLKFLSSISDLSFSPDSTSFWLGPIATIDLQRLARTPVRFHVNANFYADNSRNLHDLAGLTAETKWVAQFAYGMGASRFRAAVGVDTSALEKLVIPLMPFAEYHAEVVTADADPDPTYSLYMPPVCGTAAGRPCKNNRDQQWATLGVRGRLWKGLTADAGVDIRVRSTGFAYGPPLPPYNVVFGLAYPLDIDAFRRPVIVTIEKEAPAPVEGTVAGQVKNSKDGTPVAGAIVAVAGRPRARVATDPDGSFQSVPLSPGPTEIEVSAPGFDATKVAAKVVAGHPVEVAVALTPKIATGNVRGKVSDDRGQGLQASLKFLGPDNFEAKSDPTGLFSASLPVGPYKVVAEAPGFPTKEAQLDIAAAQDKQLDILLRNRPVNPNVTLTDTGITLKQPIRFRPGVAKLDAKAEAQLDGVADIMEDHHEIKSLRVEAHWDTTPGPKVKDVTQQQADAIKAYLVKKGVSDGRIDAAGMGAERPLVPNIGPASKAKNRRVDLIVVR